MPDFDYRPEDDLDFGEYGDIRDEVLDLRTMPYPFDVGYDEDWLNREVPTYDIINGGKAEPGGWDKILKAILGNFGGAAGGGDTAALLAGLLPLLLSGGLGAWGTSNKNDATEAAAAELKAGAEKANALAMEQIGGARGAFTPYQNAGADAVGQLSGMVGNNNLAGKYGPVGQASDLASKFKGAMTMRQLAGK